MTSATNQKTARPSRQRRLAQLVDRLAKARVGVIGDLVCDIYVTGLTDRVSREAPVLIIEQEDEWIVPGCAANTACNIASLGAAVHLVGIIGDDRTGRRLRDKLDQIGVNTGGILQAKNRQTIAKTRFLAGARHTSRQQVLRLDRQPAQPPDGSLHQQLLQQVARVSPNIDAWIICDYGYNSFDKPLRDALAAAAAEKPVIADSRFNLMDFKNVTLVKPNEQEALAAANTDDVAQAAAYISRQTNASAVLVTLGNQGMYLHQPDATERIPAAGTDEIVDLTGAGDTVAAILGAALACSADLSLAAHLANVAGGLVVMKEGCAAVTRDELHAALKEGQ
jgi:rfaE bifunctional protein kinase chain/domain